MNIPSAKERVEIIGPNKVLVLDVIKSEDEEKSSNIDTLIMIPDAKPKDAEINFLFSPFVKFTIKAPTKVAIPAIIDKSKAYIACKSIISNPSY